MARYPECFQKTVKLIFAGPPGSGKGTYGKIVAKNWGMCHVSVGDLIRKELARCKLDVESKFRVHHGMLIEDGLAAEICKNHVHSSPEQNSWIFDGFPRTVQQAEMLRSFARPHVCVNFILPNNILLKKLLGRRVCELCGDNFNTADIREAPYEMPAILPKRGCHVCGGDAPLIRRVDDTHEAIQRRLDMHAKLTGPMLAHYDAEGILLNFDVVKGTGDVGRLQCAILSFLQRRYGMGNEPTGSN